MTVDDLAQEIRRVDGNNSLGAGALAEALMPFIVSIAEEAARIADNAPVGAYRTHAGQCHESIASAIRSLTFTMSPYRPSLAPTPS